MQPRLLIVDDDAGTLTSLARAFRLEGYEAVTADSGATALAFLDRERVDAILSDVVMPQMDGLALLEALRQRDIDVPVILMSGQATLDMAVRATRLGALDFVEKPVSLDRLLLTLRNALQLDRLARENRELTRYWREELALIGDSAPMNALRQLIERAAPADVGILIQGENGTGKELVARAVHELSPRRAGPFVKMNCAAVPSDLVESELFGHEKGAFSGATGQHHGRFEQAHRGTLLLDEIGDMPPAMQAKLLRVLEDGEITRVGAHASFRVDVRVIAATNRHLETLVQEGRFREDLLYRLNTLTIRTPTLRERLSDIPALADHFARAAAGRHHWRPRSLAPDALALLAAHSWRGNVRELRNVVERLLILGTNDPIDADDVRAALPAGTPPPSSAVPTDGPLADLVAAFERDVIRFRLRRFKGHVANTARSLNLERSHLYKKCRQLGLDMREDDGRPEGTP